MYITSLSLVTDQASNIFCEGWVNEHEKIDNIPVANPKKHKKESWLR